LYALATNRFILKSLPKTDGRYQQKMLKFAQAGSGPAAAYDLLRHGSRFLKQVVMVAAYTPGRFLASSPLAKDTIPIA
jgi:hypothetical protein